MKNEVLLGNGVGAGPEVWSKNPIPFTWLDVSDHSHYYPNLFQKHYGKHKMALLTESYLKQIDSMTVKQWRHDLGDGLVIFPKRFNPPTFGNKIDYSLITFYFDEHCIVWLGYDRKILRQITKIAKELCGEYYPNDDTTKFLRLIKYNYTKKHGGTPWVKTID